MSLSLAVPTRVKMLCALPLSAAVVVTAAQADEAIPRIGVVAQLAYEQGLREGLTKLGYVEGKNIAIDWRRSGGSVDQERALALDLLHSNPAVIVAFGTPSARAAMEVAAVPIVFVSSDPIGSGLVASLAAGWQRHRCVLDRPRLDRQASATA